MRQRITSVVRLARFHVRPYQRVAATLGTALVAPLVPSRLDPTLTRAVCKVFLLMLPHRRSKVAGQMAAQLGARPEEMQAAADRYWQQRVESRWGQSRGVSVRGWRPTVEFRGVDRIRSALQSGNGVILWRVSSHSAIPLNQALASADLAPVHLSTAGHLLLSRPSRRWARFAIGVAPLLRRGEDQPLRERVEIGSSGAARATRRLIDVLSENAVVTIVGDLSGNGTKSRAVRVNHSNKRLALGGARIAARSGASLLPVTMTRTAPFTYRIDVHEALTADPTRSAAEQADQLLDGFAEVLSAWIEEDPAQWPKWRATLS